MARLDDPLKSRHSQLYKENSMHRRDLLRTIARNTGDTISTIKRHGFQLEAMPLQNDGGDGKQRSPKRRNRHTKVKNALAWSMLMNDLLACSDRMAAQQ
ncbi:MAG: hypothetical protein U0796_00385 [Gemmatales bacterium]